MVRDHVESQEVFSREVEEHKSLANANGDTTGQQISGLVHRGGQSAS